MSPAEQLVAHPLVAAVRPVLDALGATVIPAGDAEIADIVAYINEISQPEK